MAARNGSGFLPSTYDSTLRAGYEMQFDATLQRMLLNTTPAYEHLNDNGGGMDVALMHPLSRGTVQITSTDPFATPAIDPRWLINPFDMQVLIAAMQFNQLIIDTPPIQQLQPSYSQLPQNPSVDTLTTYIKENARTEFHYSGTCAMMPQQLGGVVDPDLLVYGTDNVRVVDTSIFPIIPAAHLQAVAYAVAEKVGHDIRDWVMKSLTGNRPLTLSRVSLHPAHNRLWLRRRRPGSGIGWSGTFISMKNREGVKVVCSVDGRLFPFSILD